MTHTNFVAAMTAKFSVSDYDRPDSIRASQSEWIILTRWGASGQYLSLSHTLTDAAGQMMAPRGLQPMTTHLGVLAAEHSPGDAQETEYLLVRHLPAGVPVGGIFQPSDGFVRVFRQGRELRVAAHGRYAHSHGSLHGQPVVADVPDPAPGFTCAKAWHLTAARRPWIGEFGLDQACAGDSRAG